MLSAATGDDAWKAIRGGWCWCGCCRRGTAGAEAVAAAAVVVERRRRCGSDENDDAAGLTASDSAGAQLAAATRLWWTRRERGREMDVDENQKECLVRDDGKTPFNNTLLR
jgi:hypothetical protein